MRKIAVPLLLSLSMLGCQIANAQSPPNTDSAFQQRLNAAWEAAANASSQGPKDIPVLGQATIKLPAGYAYVPVKEATALMSAMGNQTGSGFGGLILPTAEGAGDWFVTINWVDEGYVKDDDAKEWDKDELLQSLKDGTEEGNKERVKAGVAPIMVTRWIEEPRYDASVHKLVWSVEVKARARPDPYTSVNYNTYVLGREGYLTLNFVTASSAIEAEKPYARELLAATTFNEGKRYADFDASSDKVAEYGLAALVAGAAAKKLGLFALIGAFLAKSAKLLFVAALAAAGAVKKFLTGRSGGDSTGSA